MPYPRAKFVSAEIRGGTLRRSGDPEPNTHAEAAYSIRLDPEPFAHAPLSMGVWLHVLLTEDERRQWSSALLEGL